MVKKASFSLIGDGTFWIYGASIGHYIRWIYLYFYDDDDDGSRELLFGSDGWVQPISFSCMYFYLVMVDIYL